MRTNGLCKNSHTPWHWLKPCSVFCQNPILPKDQNNYEKISTLYRCLLTHTKNWNPAFQLDKNLDRRVVHKISGMISINLGRKVQ